MLPFNATDMIRVMNTDYAQRIDRARWHQDWLENYPTKSHWFASLLRWRRPERFPRLTTPQYELVDARF